MTTATLGRTPVEATHQQDDPGVAERRRAAVAAAVAGFGFPVWFWVTMAWFGLRDQPDLGGDYVAFYVDNHSRFPVHATAWVVGWALLLVLLVAVVRAIVTRLHLTALLAIATASAATACAVMAEGVLLWPLFTYEGSPTRLAADLDPDVAEALVLARDGLHAPALVLFGLAVLLIAWLLLRSDTWGHRTMAVLTAVVGVFSVGYILLGPESAGAMLTVPWGMAMGVVLLVDRARR